LDRYWQLLFCIFDRHLLYFQITINTIIEATKVVVQEMAKESVNEIGKEALEKGSERLIESFDNKYLNMDFANPPDHMKDYKLFKEINNAKENPQTRTAFIGKLLSNDSNMKGQIGEALAFYNIKDTFGGEILNQVKSGLNRLDYLATKTEKNASIVTFTVKDGKTVAEKLYIPKGKSIAFEIKNGTDGYVKSEINAKHALSQVAEGKKMADYSFLCINQDTAKAIIQKQNLVDEILELQKNGSQMVVSLPSESIQVAKVMEELK
jgi:hypothetical protein